MPLWFIASTWGNQFVGYFSLVLSTLALPTRLFGTAVGQVFYQRASKTFSENKPFVKLLLSSAFVLFLIALPGFSFVYFFTLSRAVGDLTETLNTLACLVIESQMVPPLANKKNG